ncbi:MAG: antitoxin [Dehalococcoidia bacterium]|jgi:hypothetical protein
MGRPGRPPGAFKTEKIEIKIQPKLKIAFQKHVREKGSNASSKICELIKDYLEQEGVEVYEK